MASRGTQQDTHQTTRPTNAARTPFQVRGLPGIGSALEFRRNPAKFLNALREAHGDVVGFRLGHHQVYLLSHPDAVQHVLGSAVRNYPKAGYDRLEPLIGRGLLASEGELWRRQRRLMQPSFHRERVASMVETMSESAGAVLERWRGLARGRAAGREPVVDVEEEMTRLTLSIVSRTLLGRDVSQEAETVGRSLRFVLWYGTRQMGRLVHLPAWTPTPKRVRYRRALGALDRVVYSIIDERRAAGEEHGDLLSMLLAARDEDTGEPMDEKQLRDEVMTILTAGHETTAKALTWGLYLMDRHPGAASRVRAEIAEVLGGRVPGYEDLRRLPYTRMFLEESMRLFTPVWGLARHVLEDDVVGGYDIPGGSRVIVSPYATHRHPEFWPDPENFDPSRFGDERSAGRPAYAYFPFGGGSRRCIGKDFAMAEALVILSMVAQEFGPTLCADQEVDTEAIFTLRPRHGLRMRLTA